MNPTEPWQHPQLVLSLGPPSDTRFDSFSVAADNRLVVTSVENLARGQLAEPQVYLWGEAGVGKTHLLTAICETASRGGWRVAYLGAGQAGESDALEGLERCDIICIDDVQQLAATAQTALFHCINRCRETGCRMVFAASGPPEALDFALADLTTRLEWGPVFQVHALNEQELRAALTAELQRRALVVAPEVIDYLLRRFPRDMASMKRVIEALDDASLQVQRRVTIPLVRSVVGDGAVPDSAPYRSHR